MKLELGQVVYHEKLYWGKEPMKVVGIREKEVELEGDYSGGTHAVCQKDWLPLEGILLSKSEKPYSEILHSLVANIFGLCVRQGLEAQKIN